MLLEQSSYPRNLLAWLEAPQHAGIMVVQYTGVMFVQQ